MEYCLNYVVFFMINYLLNFYLEIIQIYRKIAWIRAVQRILLCPVSKFLVTFSSLLSFALTLILFFHTFLSKLCPSWSFIVDFSMYSLRIGTFSYIITVQLSIWVNLTLIQKSVHFSVMLIDQEMFFITFFPFQYRNYLGSGIGFSCYVSSLFNLDYFHNLYLL